MWQRFSPTSRAVILRAQDIALRHNHEAVSPTHLFLSLLEVATPHSSLGALLLRAGLKLEEARLYAEATLEQKPDTGSNSEIHLSKSAKRVLEVAIIDARSPLVEPTHLLLACISPRIAPELAATLAPLGWDLSVLRAKQRELDALQASRSNPLEMLTGNAEIAIENSYKAMRATWCGRISTAHLLLGILEDDRVLELLVEIGAPIDEIKIRARTSIRSDSELATPNRRFDQGAKRALHRAQKEATSRGYKFIGPEHILLALLPQRATMREKLKWGLQVPDEAALLLAQLDSRNLRALLMPSRRHAPLQAQPTSSDVSRSAISSIFCSLLVAGCISSAILFQGRKIHSPWDVVGISTFLILLLTTSLGACWVLMTSDKPNLKSAWSAAFFGFLLGTMLTTFLFAH